MRLKISLVSALGVALVAATAYAHTPTITVDPIESLSYPTFPQMHDVTGTVSHNPIAVVQNLALHVNDTVVASSSAPFALLVGTTSPYVLPWEISGPGTYTLFVTARHGVGGQTGTSTEESVVVAQTVVVTQCPAAPAIAGEYLKNSIGVKSGSTVYKNVMQAVAQQTGSKGVLWAESACEAWYPNAVKAFVGAFL